MAYGFGTSVYINGTSNYGNMGEHVKEFFNFWKRGYFFYIVDEGRGITLDLDKLEPEERERYLNCKVIKGEVRGDEDEIDDVTVYVDSTRN